MLTHVHKLDMRLGHAMTPRMQQAVRLLLMSSQEYEQELLDLANRNPFLLVETGSAAPLQHGDSPAADTGLQPAPADGGAPAADSAGDADDGAAPPVTDDLFVDAESWTGMATSAGSSEGGAAHETACETSLQQHLLAQARLLPLSERDRALVAAVIVSLEDDGYLRTDMDEVAACADVDPPPTEVECNTALRLVQSFEPAGVGARDLTECLLLQLRAERSAAHATGDADAPPCPLLAIVDRHLPALARGDVRGVARELQLDEQQVQQAFARIRRLDPHPGWKHQQMRIDYVRPDVIVRRDGGRWQARLNPAAMPRVDVDQRTAALFQQHRQAQHAALGAELQEARWAVRNARQRYATILAVAQAIVRRQQGFFDNGPLALRPLALRDIAADVGVHESTVSRVTNNKYMDTPNGLIELKRFFARPMRLESGGASTPAAIRSLVREMIESENRAEPLSDVQITHSLTRQGLHVARRTVTKYRQMLRIPPAEQRRAAGTAAAATAPQGRNTA